MEVVGGLDAVCSGDSVSVQCTLSGDMLTWITPDGALNLLRGRQSIGDAGAYHWILQELDESLLQSTVTFTVTTQTTMTCLDRSNSSEVTINIEGMFRV